MAAELRPVGRQTTPPGRAGELRGCKSGKQPDFLKGLRQKESVPAQMAARQARGRQGHTGAGKVQMRGREMDGCLRPGVIGGRKKENEVRSSFLGLKKVQ